MRIVQLLSVLAVISAVVVSGDFVGRNSVQVNGVTGMAHADSTGWVNPSNLVGGTPITTVATIKSHPNTKFSQTQGLEFQFDFVPSDIPDGSVIDGVELVMNVNTMESSGVGLRFFKGQVTLNGASSPQRGSTGAWDQTGPKVITMGNPTDKWGITWTRNLVIQNNIFFRFIVDAFTGEGKPVLSGIQVVIHFTPPVVVSTTGAAPTETSSSDPGGSTTGGTTATTSSSTTGAVVIDCSGMDDCNAAQGKGVCTGPSMCTCTEGYTGATCAIPTCTTPQCHENQTCLDVNFCVCQPEFVPPLCRVRYQCAAVAECNGNGVCTSQDSCTCDPGFQPPDCLIPYSCDGIGGCSSRNGICVETDECLCDDNWGGPTCEIPDCSDVGNCTSAENGICIAPNTCNCQAGWSSEDCSQEFAVKDDTAGVNIGLVVGIAVGGAVLLGVSCIIVAVLLLRGRNKAGRVFVPPKHALVAFGRDLNLLYDASPEYLNHLSLLMELLLQPGFEVIKAIARVTSATEADSFAKSAVMISAAQCSSVAVIQTFVDAEISRTTDTNTLFRGNSLATKMFQGLSRVIGLQYLWANLGQILTDLVEDDESDLERNNQSSTDGSMKTVLQHSFEIDSSRMSPEQAENISVNKYKLMLSAQSLLTAIMKSAEFIPLPLRQICTRAAGQLPENAKGKAVGGFIFLRFIVPAIATPHMFGLFKEPPNTLTQRKLILLSKILQNIANNVPFSGKEEFMVKLNDIMEENRDKIREFFNQLSAADVSIPEPQLDIPKEVVLNALCDMHGHINAKLFDILEELRDHEEMKTRLQQVMESLGDPVRKKK